MSKRQIILDTVDDLVGDFLYYGRKEDDELPAGEIEKSIADGDVSAKEIVALFEAKLNEGLNIEPKPFNPHSADCELRKE